MRNSEKNYIFSEMLISYFADCNVECAFISPGSRNTPLTQALLNNKDIKTYSIVDERSSAYVALGFINANSYKRPVIIVTTSGTAVANLFPGIIEAYMSRTPIIVITADRPKRLIDTGANQTIYQNNIFGKYAFFFDARPYVKNIDKYFENYKQYKQGNKKSNSYEWPSSNTLRMFVRIIVDAAIDRGSAVDDDSEEREGPVHLNVPFDFDDPLYEKSKKIDFPEIDLYKDMVSRDLYLTGGSRLESVDYVKGLANPSKILIIYTDEEEKDYDDPRVLDQAEALQIPVFMDCRCLRFGKKYKNIITSYDFILKNYEINPNLILRYGPRPISKELNQLIDNHKEYKMDIYSEKGVLAGSDNRDPSEFLDYGNIKNNKSWFDKLINMQKAIENQIKSFFKVPKCHEGYIINTIISTMPKNSNLMIGNSSPIRDLDTFTFNLDKKINVYSNRGASGIDGLISTAIGMSIKKKTFNTLIIGDVSFYYDLTALNIAKNIPINLTIFIINNNGGHIFDRLDGLKTQKKSNYKKYWLTPVNLDIKSAAKTFDCNYQKINLNQYKKLDTIINQLDTKDKKINLVEIIVDSEKNYSNNKELEGKIKKLFN